MKTSQNFSKWSISRAVGRFENPGVLLLFGGHNLPSDLPPLVKIGLTDLPKSRGATPRDDWPEFSSLITRNAMIYVTNFFNHR